jgi:hypothetical protein
MVAERGVSGAACVRRDGFWRCSGALRSLPRFTAVEVLDVAGALLRDARTALVE